MPSECYRLTIQGISTGEQTQNVLHFLVDNNDDAQPLDLAKELVDFWNTSFKTQWLTFNSNRYAIRWIEAKRVLPGGGNSYWLEFPEGVAVGAINDEQGVLQLAPIVKLFAGLTEGTQGRTFLPPPAQSSVTNNVIDVSYINDVIDCYEDMQNFAPDHVWNLAVFSRKNGVAAGVSSVAISNMLGSMGKRRKPM